MPYSLNHYHRQVCKWLSELGIPYMEEYEAGQYSLDLYLPDLRRGVEIDGPQHSTREDGVRDELIFTVYGIQIVRVKVGTRKQEALEAILEH